LITTDGKQIIAKYLLDQAPAFATHIAAGCGTKPLLSGDEANISASVQSLDFELFREPILAKGFVNEGGVEKIVFKAQMPTTQRYLISEVGLYPAGTNVIAGKYDSRLLVTFTSAEPWSYVTNGSASAIEFEPNGVLNLTSGSAITNDITTTTKGQFINSDSTIFNTSSRSSRLEQPRLLSRALMVSGSSSFLTLDPGDPTKLIATSSASYIENSSINFDFSQNITTDKLKLAFSLLSRTASVDTAPASVRILLEFTNGTTLPGTSPKAKLSMILSSSDFQVDGDANRYVVVTKSLSNFERDTDFTFSNINGIRIYTSILVGGVPTDNYLVAYDGLRIDNVSTINPLYSLVGYDVIKTDNGLPILKQENTNNYIEYRFGIGVTS
jgi:hypothetical protein